MTGPGTYRHKPTIIHAMQFTPENARDLANWLAADHGQDKFEMTWPDNSHLTIETLEGDRDCPSGYWILRGVAGEFYPIHPDIFARNYEPAGGEF